MYARSHLPIKATDRGLEIAKHKSFTVATKADPPSVTIEERLPA
jgi:hypothetical protein